MATATQIATEITNGTIVLPKSILKNWQGMPVYISFGENDIFIKKMQRPSLSTMLDALNKVGKNIPRSTLRSAIKWARRKNAR